jgi:hypothetical protein
MNNPRAQEARLTAQHLDDPESKAATLKVAEESPRF